LNGNFTLKFKQKSAKQNETRSSIRSQNCSKPSKQVENKGKLEHTMEQQNEQVPINI